MKYSLTHADFSIYFESVIRYFYEERTGWNPRLIKKSEKVSIKALRSFSEVEAKMETRVDPPLC